MAPTALLTLGRMPKGLELARALKAVGWRVVVADPFAWHLCRTSRDVDKSIKVRAPVDDAEGFVEDLAVIAETEGARLVIPVSEEAMFAAALKDRLPPEIRFLGPDLATIRQLYDKAAFIDRAAALGLAVPETHLLGTPGAEALAAGRDVVLKRVFSSAGVGVDIRPAGSALPDTSDTPVLVQARLPGRHRSSVSLAHGGKVLGHVFYEGTVTSHTVSVAFRRIDAPDLETWVDAFVAATGYSGFIAFDFIDDAARVAHAIECNPRANSGVHFFDRESLGRAMTAPETVDAPIAHKPAQLMQQVLPCLTETQGNVFNADKRRNHWHYLRASRDVTWERRDPWPLILMTFSSYEILRRSIFKGESFGEAAVADIAWDGGRWA